MPRMLMLFLLSGFSIHGIAQMPKATAKQPVSKPAITDTAIVVIKPDSNLVPFEPYETNFNNGFKAAHSTSERTALLRKYIDTLYSSALTAEQKKALLSDKVKQYVATDFYSLYESFQYAAAKENNLEKARFFVGVFRSSVTTQQWDAITEYNKYVVASAEVLVYNQTTGKTEKLSRPSGWPAGLPMPGYGWGKYQSSDDVAPPVSMQYHLRPQERYDIISRYKTEGKKISPDDQAWYTTYQLNYVQQKPATTTSTGTTTITPEQKLQYLVGRYYSFKAFSQLDCTTCKVIAYKDVNQIQLQCKYGVSKTATYEELENNKEFFGFHPATAVLQRCKVCNGNGVVKSTFSHTNDYQYTLGKKITYTQTTVTNCGACGGSGYTDDILK